MNGNAEIVLAGISCISAMSNCGKPLARALSVNDIDIDTVDIVTDLHKRNYMLNIFVQSKLLKGRFGAAVC